MRLIDADSLKKAIIELNLDNSSHWSVIHKIDNAATVEPYQGKECDSSCKFWDKPWSYYKCTDCKRNQIMLDNWETRE